MKLALATLGLAAAATLPERAPAIPLNPTFTPPMRPLPADPAIDPNIADALSHIIHSPVRPLLPLPLIADNATVDDMVNHDVVPTVVTTPPRPLGPVLPALMNASTGGDATALGGVTFPGFGGPLPEQGTSVSVGFVSHVDVGGIVARSPVAEMREVVAGRKRQGGDFAQPDMPAVDPASPCVYQYEHVLGGDGSAPRGALWANEGVVDFVAADVMQGGIGNCGMGAAVMALAAGGWTQYLRNSLKRVGQGEGSYTVRLYKDGAWENVAIDDQLPVLVSGSPCYRYVGYQPVNDAVVDATEPSGFRSTPIFFMPLLEKAFVKFLDAHPDWKAPGSEVPGYGGTEAIAQSRVLSALTGGTPRFVVRSQSGYDVRIAVALATCMLGRAPCVIGTANATTLEHLGAPDTFGTVWLNPEQETGYLAGRTPGMVGSDAPDHDSFTLVDFDQVQKVDGKDKSTALTVVGKHAYAFDWFTSARFPIPEGEEAKAMTNLINPWGTNPCWWPGGRCGDITAVRPPSRLALSFRTLAMTALSVSTVTDMPPA